MAKIGLIDVDGHNFPNLALMKLAAYHRAQGDDVEMVEPLYWDYDRIYASKVFTFTPDIERSFGCDTTPQIAHCENAIALLRSKGYTGRFFLYCILNDNFQESFERIDYWHRKADWKIHPYAQPYRDPFQHGRTTPYGSATSIGGATEKSTTSHVTSGSSPLAKISHAKPTSTIPQWQRDLAQWTNRHGFYEACDFRDFSPRKNFTCAAYLQNNQANQATEK